MKNIKSLFHVGSLSLLTMVIAVACGQPRNNSAAINTGAGGKKTSVENEQAVLKSVFTPEAGEYDPTKPENQALLAEIEGVTINLEPYEPKETEKKKEFWGEVRFILKNQDSYINGALNEISSEKLTQLAITSAPSDKYQIEAKCGKLCDSLVVRLREAGNPVREVVAVFRRNSAIANEAAVAAAKGTKGKVERQRVANDGATLVFLGGTRPQAQSASLKPTVEAVLAERAKVKPQQAPAVQPAGQPQAESIPEGVDPN